MPSFTGFKDIKKTTEQEIRELLFASLPDDERFCDRLEETLAIHGVTRTVDLMNVLCEIDSFLERNDDLSLSELTLTKLDVLFQDCENYLDFE